MITPNKKPSGETFEVEEETQEGRVDTVKLPEGLETLTKKREVPKPVKPETPPKPIPPKQNPSPHEANQPPKATEKPEPLQFAHSDLSPMEEGDKVLEEKDPNSVEDADSLAKRVINLQERDI